MREPYLNGKTPRKPFLHPIPTFHSHNTRKTSKLYFGPHSLHEGGNPIAPHGTPNPKFQKRHPTNHEWKTPPTLKTIGRNIPKRETHDDSLTTIGISFPNSHYMTNTRVRSPLPIRRMDQDIENQETLTHLFGE